MDQNYLGIIVYENSPNFVNNLCSDNSLKFISENSRNDVEEVRKKIKDLAQNRKACGFEYERGYFNIRHYQYPGKCNEDEDTYCQFKGFIILEIEFITDFKNHSLEHTRWFCSFFRNLFIFSKGYYSCFQFEIRLREYYPTNKDLQKGTICYWVYQNLFSKKLFNRICKDFLPSKDKFQFNQYEDGTFEYLANLEDDHGLYSFISNNEFIDKRFRTKRERNGFSSEELEDRIAYLVRKAKESSATKIDELRALGLDHERYQSIIRELADYKLNRYKQKDEGTSNLFNADILYSELKDKNAMIEIIRIYLSRYEKYHDEIILKIIKSDLEKIPIKKDYLRENAPDIFDKIMKLNIDVK